MVRQQRFQFRQVFFSLSEKAFARLLEDIDQPVVKKQVEDLSIALQNLTDKINSSTTSTANAATWRESSATDTMVIVTITALILALCLAVWILRSIGTQLGGDPAALEKVAESLANGDLALNRNESKTGVYRLIFHHRSIRIRRQ